LSISTGLKITNPSNNYYVDVAQGGLDTNNPLGITINSATGYTTACNFGGDIDMTSNNIIKCSSVSNSQGNISISSVADDVNLSAGGGAICSITAGTTNVSASDILTITGTTGVYIEGTNDLISLSSANGIYINDTGGSGGNGNIYANNFFGNASSASFANSATTATTSTNSNISVVSTGVYYPNFTTNTTGSQAVLASSSLTYNATTNNLSATTFTGALSGNATTATNSTNATNTSTTLTTTAGTYYPVFVSSNVSGNYPNLVGTMTYNPSSNTLTANTFSGLLSTGGLVYLSTSQFSVVGSASAQTFSIASIFNSTYKNYRVVLNSASQVSFTAYPNYSLAGYLGTGVPTTGSLYGNELTSAASSSIVAVYTAGATLSSAPLQFAVSSLTNKQVILEVENVGFANTASQVVGLKCKSFYGNPGVSGYSDRNILSTSLNGATITGLTIQQSSLGVGNNMTLQAVVYGYK
jgi:hypothetical protein